ncbi:polysaccharide pyruvyl transferase family protein [Clostridium taeniosporum]|uniref:Polysaccharide pyruvyl transferase family protein n=1 Tax=Clostridium taeniosporum TaxID=394958 RepID=A0A1D7XMI8_9CLOT|nr:polysaccharide pyruvyl transferase family protein [Clostridium taeniosporum]AOR24583.1 polysaccharide pyruvyl transferase family protein [Clostridium taeniosporum]
MKVGIVTFHFVNNFGGALQTYALSEVVTELNKEKTIIIDYRHWFIRFTDFIRVFPITTNVKEVLSGLTTFKERIGRIKKFQKFNNDNFLTSSLYTSEKKLNQCTPQCDKFICGSDQIWNPIITLGVCSPYYLNFVKDKEKKISYAASFGVTEINSKYYSNIEKYLQQFKAISVREKEGVDLVKKISGIDAECLIDPTFLLTKEQWIKIAEEPKNKEPYILVYMMQKNDSVYEYARKIKEILNIKVIDISRYGFKQDFVDEVCIDIGPKEFVGLFNNASYVCTNSFHGLAFSLILEKNFFIVPSTRFNSRIGNLMNIFNLELIKDINKDVIEKESYDKNEIRKIMNKERQKSISFLKKNLFND